MTAIPDPWSGVSAFVRAVDAKSFSAAARALGTTPSAVSKAVVKLESRLGVRLLQRTTRALSLTHEGMLFYERVSKLLTELDEAEAALASKKGLRGTLRVSAPVELGRTFVAGAVRAFLERHPAVRVELSLADRFVDLVEERIDVAVRVGRLEPSSLIARRIGQARNLVYAAPRYLRRAGHPRHPGELAQHACLRYLSGGERPLPWVFRGPDGLLEVPVRGPLDSDNGSVLRQAAAEGLGLIRTLDALVGQEVAAGHLRCVLEAFAPEPLPIHAVFTPTRNLAPTVHAFVDELVRHWRTRTGAAAGGSAGS